MPRAAVDPAQTRFIASNAQSLAQAKANPALLPLAVYDRVAREYPESRVPMVGSGLILRLIIDRAHHRKGLTSHRHDNSVVAALFRSLGFVPWELDGIALKPGEVYLRLPTEPR